MLKNRMRGWIYCLLSAILVVALVALLPSRDMDEPDEPPRVVFSKPSGFYDDEFYLEMDGGGNDIYYTLDSSDPTVDSIRYTGPVLIQDASPNVNVYSAIADVSPYLRPDLTQMYGYGVYSRYQIPLQPVDKATVVRAVSVDASGKCGKAAEAVYFVGFDKKTGYQGMNVMTITTDPDNLFGYENGIYVFGKTFDDAIEAGKVDFPDLDIVKWPANYRQKGLEWEREADIHCFDADGETVFSGRFGIRVQGNTSRGRLPKNLNIYARKKYGQGNINTGPLFGTNYNLNRLNLSKGSDSLLINDWIFNMLIEGQDLAITYREYVPCVLFLDGEYWGVYWLSPRFKKDYFSRKYGVDGEDVVMVKQGSIEVGEASDLALYEEMLEYISNSDMRQQEAYQSANGIIDMQSLIDYYALEIYIANNDWNPSNVGLWRTKNASSSRWSDGRWRWILFDIDLSMRPKYSKNDNLNATLKKDPLLVSLMRNEAFSATLHDRLMQLATEVFLPEKVEALVEDYKALMADAIEKKRKRFNGDDKAMDDFYTGCDSVTQFFRDRQAYVIKTYGGIE